MRRKDIAIMTIRADGKRAIISDVALVREGMTTEFDGDVTVSYIFLPLGPAPQLHVRGVTPEGVIQIGVSGCETGAEHADAANVTLQDGRKVTVFTAVKKLDSIGQTSLFRIQCAAYYA
jgi:hypothetical protein